MPIQTPLAVAIYLTIWWIVLFAVLPLEVRSLHEEDGAARRGEDPGAPLAPRLLKKALLTTVISTIVFALFLLALKFMP
jgi:predicted secreted protein